MLYSNSTSCGSCVHVEVCSRRSDYEHAVDRINSTTIGLNDGGSSTVKNLDFLSVKVSCKTFIAKTGTR